MRALVRILGFAVTLALLWASGLMLGWGVSNRDQFVQRKLEGADRVLYYEFSTVIRPRFRLSGIERELSLVTHLVLPPDSTYDPVRDYEYGVMLRLLAPTGQAIWERRLYTRSRQSKAEFIDGAWNRENTFSLDPHQQFTDDRVLRVRLPPNYPPRSQLEIGLLAEPGLSGLLRVYERSERTVVDAQVVRLGLSPRDKRQLINRLTYLPWTALSEIQRWTRLRFQWNRLSAIGEDDVSTPTQTVYFTGFRTPPPPPPRDSELVLGPDLARVFNVEGPALLAFEGGATCAGETPARVEINAYTPAGAKRTGTIAPCQGTRTWWIESGIHSLHVSADRRLPLSVKLYEGRAFPPQQADDGRLVPDVSLWQMYATGPGYPPVRYELPTSNEIDARTLRVDVRGDAGFDDRSEVTLLFEFLDERGRVLDRGEAPLELDARGLRFEFRRSPAGEIPLSDPVTPRLIAPKRAHSVRLSTNTPAFIAVKTYFPLLNESRVIAPYASIPLENTRWRHAPLERRRWWTLRASNHHTLEQLEAVISVAGQVRLEPLPTPAPSPQDTPRGHRWRSVDPSSVHEQHLVLQRTRASDIDFDDAATSYTRIALGRTIPFTTHDAATTRILYQVRGSLTSMLGSTIRIDIDGVPVTDFISSSRGRWQLPFLSPGRHHIRIEADRDSADRDLLLFVDRPGRGPRYTHRTLHRLATRPMIVQVDKPGSESVYINAVFYRCGTLGSNQVDIALDDGEPSRVRGQVVAKVTVAERTLDLAPESTPIDMIFLTRTGGRCAIAGRFPLAIGPDIVQGPHRFTLRLTSGEPLWVRFFRRSAPGDDGNDESFGTSDDSGFSSDG